MRVILVIQQSTSFLLRCHWGDWSSAGSLSKSRYWPLSDRQQAVPGIFRALLPPLRLGHQLAVAAVLTARAPHLHVSAAQESSRGRDAVRVHTYDIVARLEWSFAFLVFFGAQCLLPHVLEAFPECDVVLLLRRTGDSLCFSLGLQGVAGAPRLHEAPCHR